mgnify:CR=1 FL=1
MKINTDDTRFLKIEDVQHKDTVSIESEGIWQDSNFKDEDGNPQREFRIHFKLGNGETRSTTLRSSNVKLLGRTFGDETRDWVGKELRAWKTKSEKAKAGYVFLFVPTDWERDDTGEWVRPEGAGKTDADYPQEDIKPEDIPF